MPDPLQILRERLAKGEISEEEYTRLQGILSASDATPSDLKEPTSPPEQDIAGKVTLQKKSPFWTSTFPIIIVLSVVSALAKLYFRDAEAQNISQVIAGAWSCTVPEDIANKEFATYGFDISKPNEKLSSDLTVLTEARDGGINISITMIGEYRINSGTALSLDYTIKKILVTATSQGNEALLEASPYYVSGNLERIIVKRFSINGEVAPTELSEEFTSVLSSITIARSSPYKMVVSTFSDSSLSIDGVECKK
jgi:hypothetical protein